MRNITEKIISFLSEKLIETNAREDGLAKELIGGSLPFIWARYNLTKLIQKTYHDVNLNLMKIYFVPIIFCGALGRDWKV